MKGLNVVTLLGNSTKEAELKFTSGGTAVCTFNLAVEDQWADAEGDKKTSTNFINCKAWGALAEKVCAPHIGQGTRLSVVGKLHTYSYDKNGSKVYGYEVTVSDVVLLGDSKPSRK